jgi:hypothetical protein
MASARAVDGRLQFVGISAPSIVRDFFLDYDRNLSHRNTAAQLCHHVSKAQGHPNNERVPIRRENYGDITERRRNIEGQKAQSVSDIDVPKSSLAQQALLQISRILLVDGLVPHDHSILQTSLIALFPKRSIQAAVVSIFVMIDVIVLRECMPYVDDSNNEVAILAKGAIWFWCVLLRLLLNHIILIP